MHKGTNICEHRKCRGVKYRKKKNSIVTWASQVKAEKEK